MKVYSSLWKFITYILIMNLNKNVRKKLICVHAWAHVCMCACVKYSAYCIKIYSVSHFCKSLWFRYNIFFLLQVIWEGCYILWYIHKSDTTVFRTGILCSVCCRKMVAAVHGHTLAWQVGKHLNTVYCLFSQAQ